MNQKQKCLKNMQHDEITVAEYQTHIVKQCVRCKTKRYKYRRTGITINRNGFVPIRTCT